MIKETEEEGRSSQHGFKKRVSAIERERRKTSGARGIIVKAFRNQVDQVRSPGVGCKGWCFVSRRRSLIKFNYPRKRLRERRGGRWDGEGGRARDVEDTREKGERREHGGKVSESLRERETGRDDNLNDRKVGCRNAPKLAITGWRGDNGGYKGGRGKQRIYHGAPARTSYSG